MYLGEDGALCESFELQGNSLNVVVEEKALVLYETMTMINSRIQGKKKLS